MHFHFLSVPPLRRTLLSVPRLAGGGIAAALAVAARLRAPALLVLAGVAACGQSSGGASPSCPATSSPLAVGESAANGSVTGSRLDVGFCDVGVSLGRTYGTSPNPIVVSFDSTARGASSSVRLPLGGVSGTVTGALQIPSLAPGVSASSTPSLCGSLVFSYGLPTVPAASCKPDGSYNCPAGCTNTYTCASPPCCVPLATTYVYQAASSTSCTGGPAQTPLGSWSVSLTSVTPVDAGGAPAYVAHGTLEAKLQGTADATDTVSLALTF
jgi:hypothetical protein